MTDGQRSFRIGRRAFSRLATGAAFVAAAPPVIGHAQPPVLHFANIQPITGPSSPYGWRVRDGAQLAADEINASGLQVGDTTYRIELAVQDMANDPQQAVTLARQAASNADVVGIIGPTNSVGYVAQVPAVGQMQIPMIGAGTTAPIKQWNVWSFRVNPVVDTAIPIMLRVIHAKVPFKRLGVIYDQTQDGQMADANVCKQMAQPLGYQVVAFEAFRAGDQDFSPQIATLRSQHPDAIFICAATGDGVKVVPQVKDAGLNVPLLTPDGAFQDPVYWDGTHGAVQGGYTWLAQDLGSPAPALKAFLDGYRKKFSQEATTSSAYGADAVSAFAAALKKAGKPTRPALQEALASLDIVTPLGTHIAFHNPPTGENNTPTVVVVQVTGRGTYKTV
jgi:branched-chain amino acid transport system substrate-binding protein